MSTSNKNTNKNKNKNKPSSNESSVDKKKAKIVENFTGLINPLANIVTNYAKLNKFVVIHGAFLTTDVIIKQLKSIDAIINHLIDDLKEQYSIVVKNCNNSLSHLLTLTALNFEKANEVDLNYDTAETPLKTVLKGSIFASSEKYDIIEDNSDEKTPFTIVYGQCWGIIKCFDIVYGLKELHKQLKKLIKEFDRNSEYDSVRENEENTDVFQDYSLENC